VADKEEVFHLGAVVQELVEVAERGFGSECAGEQDFGLVAGLCADERGSLEAALEGAGDDEIELNVEGIEDVGELQAVLLAFLVEGAFEVELGIGAACACAGMPEDEEIHI
jgi:hypothetical protein